MNVMHNRLMALAFLLCALTPPSYSQDNEVMDLAITNVSVIDVVSGGVSRQSVLVNDGKIARVLDPGESVGQSLEVIDGTGQFLLPGLWDMHVHIVYEAQLIQQMPDLFLDYGVTSVRDTGALLANIQPELARWRALGAAAPDIFFSGPLLDGRLVVYDGNGRTEIGRSNATAQAARNQVAALVAAGVDFIKIYELVSPEVFAALVESAEAVNIPIAAHVPLSMMAETAGPRVQSMEHLRNIEIACADDAESLFDAREAMIESPGDRSGYELRRYLHQTQREVALTTADPESDRCQRVIESLKGTIQVPTLRLNTLPQYSPIRRSDWRDALRDLPGALASQWIETAEFFAGQKTSVSDQLSSWSLELVDAMQQAGVPIGAGTDTPIGQAIPGYSLHTELERLVDAGLTERQALFAATVVPAMFLELEGVMGQIKPEMEADLIVLSDNPLDNIKHTRTIQAVISDGVRVR